MLEAGRRVGRYVVESLIGMGGMGEVYRARDERLRRTVALKVVRADREDHTGVAPDDRLIAEARAAAALRHPNVVEIFDAGRDDGQTYVAMEYIEGKPLRAYVGDESVPLATRKRWMLEIGRALAAAHRAGLVHRDIKPENVLIDREGVARVLDFGLAKRLVHDTSAPTADGPRLETAEGRVVGTVSYMAPEQLAGAPPHAKWDQFAWGVLGYELLTGVHPRMAVPMPGQTAHLTQTPKMPNEIAPEIPFPIASAIMLAMAPDPARRFATMEGALDAMRDEPTVSRSTTVEAPKPVLAPPAPKDPSRWPIAIAIVAACGVGIAIGAAMRPKAAAPVAASAPPPSTIVFATPVAPPPLASSVAPLVSAKAEPTASHVAALPDDYKTACNCINAESGLLCPLGSPVRERRCECHDANAYSLSPDDAGAKLLFFGNDLADGQPCRGYELTSGAPTVGALTNCAMNCNQRGFAGIHRTSCRGLRATDGSPREGLLYCY